MLHTKFQGHWSIDSGTEDLKKKIRYIVLMRLNLIGYICALKNILFYSLLHIDLIQCHQLTDPNLIQALPH